MPKLKTGFPGGGWALMGLALIVALVISGAAQPAGQARLHGALDNLQQLIEMVEKFFWTALIGAFGIGMMAVGLYDHFWRGRKDPQARRHGGRLVGKSFLLKLATQLEFNSVKLAVLGAGTTFGSLFSFLQAHPPHFGR